MADVRVQQPVKIVDPVNNAQEAQVTADGELEVIVPTSVTPGTGAAHLGKAEDAAHSSGDTGVMALAIRDDTLAPFSGTEGDYEPLHTNALGALYVGDDGSFDVDTIKTSVVPGVGATHLGKAEDAAHTTGDTGVMALAVRQDTATALAGTDGDYIPLIVDSAGRLHVTDPNAGAGTPTNPVRTLDSAAAVAAGSEDITIQTADLGGTTKKLTGVDITASVAWKGKIQSVSDGTPTDLVVLFGDSGESVQWRPPHKNYMSVTFGANAGFDGFRCAMTNMDTSEAADLYATFYYED